MQRKMAILLTGCLCASSLSAYTLKESLSDVLSTNPKVQERLKNFRATRQDLHVAESEYYPTVDFRASYGYTSSGNLKTSGDSSYNHEVIDENFNSYQTSLTLTQNIFNGFSTTHKIDYQKARTLAAAYNYIETVNDIALKATKAYVDVLKYHDLLQTARENVQINQSIYKKVKDLFDSGLTTDSEVKKIQSSLSLAKSNLTVQMNNARDAEYAYRRIFGRMPDIADMQKPVFNAVLPKSNQRAAMYAVEHNPSLLVSRYNIEGAKALYKEAKNGYYPRIDLQLTQNFNDVEKRNSFDRVDDRFKAQVVLTYNIFKGGADSANIQKQISKINQEIETSRELKRQVIEGLDLSWDSYDMIKKQLVDLREYSQYSEETLKLYEEEYDLGRRSLLDLLASQNDVINSRSQIVKAEYDLLYAKYRILDAMGILVNTIIDDASTIGSKVNLYVDSSMDTLDKLPVKLDFDDDKIDDDLDLCDNSPKGNNIMPYGCRKFISDMDKDGVEDEKDKCLTTPAGVEVDEYGCALDTDQDGVKDYMDKCPNTPLGYSVDGQGCSISFSFMSNNVKKEIKRLADFLKRNKEYKIKIIGYNDSKVNFILRKLQALGISKDRIIGKSKEKDSEVANKIEIELVKNSEGL